MMEGHRPRARSHTFQRRNGCRIDGRRITGAVCDAARRGGSEMAFAALIERHGPMVLRVCRGVLSDPDDARRVSRPRSWSWYAGLVRSAAANSVASLASRCGLPHGVVCPLGRCATEAARAQGRGKSGVVST